MYCHPLFFHCLRLRFCHQCCHVVHSRFWMIHGYPFPLGPRILPLMATRRKTSMRSIYIVVKMNDSRYIPPFGKIVSSVWLVSSYKTLSAQQHVESFDLQIQISWLVETEFLSSSSIIKSSGKLYECLYFTFVVQVIGYYCLTNSCL